MPLAQKRCILGVIFTFYSVDSSTAKCRYLTNLEKVRYFLLQFRMRKTDYTTTKSITVGHVKH